MQLVLVITIYIFFHTHIDIWASLAQLCCGDVLWEKAAVAELWKKAELIFKVL
jgi:HEAT repeat protein